MDPESPATDRRRRRRSIVEMPEIQPDTPISRRKQLSQLATQLAASEQEKHTMHAQLQKVQRELSEASQITQQLGVPDLAHLELGVPVIEPDLAHRPDTRSSSVDSCARRPTPIKADLHDPMLGVGLMQDAHFATGSPYSRRPARCISAH